MTKGGIKRTPHEFLVNILERALAVDLISSEDISILLKQEAHVQQNIDHWRPLVRAAENEPKKEWVVVTSSFLHGAAVSERVDEHVFGDYAQACDNCRSLNMVTGTSATKMKKCKVVEKKNSIGRGEGSGRSCCQLLSLSSAEDGTAIATDVMPDWDTLLGSGNGYLALRNKNLVPSDVPGVIECITLADGLVAQLGLSQNGLEGAGVTSLCSALLLTSPCCFKNICALYLSNNSIGDEGALVVAELISSRQLPIVKVGLNSNGITDIGATAIAGTLGKSTCNQESILEVLGLSHNLITSAGAVCVARAVSENTSLQRLFLNYNSEVNDEGGQALAAAAKGHPSLLRLGVAFCSLSSLSGRALMTALSSTESLERICVSGNCFGDVTESLMGEMKRFNFAEVK